MVRRRTTVKRGAQQANARIAIGFFHIPKNTTGAKAAAVWRITTVYFRMIIYPTMKKDIFFVCRAENSRTAESRCVN